MDTAKHVALQEFLKNNNISNEELFFECEKFYRFAKTSVPIVYLENNEFTVMQGLDFSRKDNIWGIQLSNGCLFSFRWYKRSWNDVEQEISKYTLNGRKCFMPTWLIENTMLDCFNNDCYEIKKTAHILYECYHTLFTKKSGIEMNDWLLHVLSNRVFFFDSSNDKANLHRTYACDNDWDKKMILSYDKDRTENVHILIAVQ